MAPRIIRTDDVDAAVGHLSEADLTKYIGVNGEWREIDLTNENDVALVQAMQRYWDVGRTVSADVVMGATVSDLSSMRQYWDGYRAWCDERGINYTTKVARKFYPSHPRVREYNAWLVKQGRQVPPKVVEKYGIAA